MINITVMSGTYRVIFVKRSISVKPRGLCVLGICSVLFPSSWLKVGNPGIVHHLSQSAPLSRNDHAGYDLPVQSLMSSIHLLRGLSRVLLPSIIPSRTCLQRFPALMVWPKYCCFRYKEHKYALNNNKIEARALSEHAKLIHREEKVNISTFVFSILERYKTPVECKIGVALWIRTLNPQINRKLEMTRW